MAFKTILVYLDGGTRDDLHVDIALDLGKEDKAYLIGLHVIHPFYPTMGAFGDAAAGVIADVQQEYLKEARANAEALRARIEKRVKQSDLAFEWRCEEGFAEDILPLHARYSDLTVMGQADPEAEAPPTSRNLPIHMIMESGRPALVIPYAGKFATIGKRVLVAWNGSREATRAVHDALPILERAELVSVLSINPRGADHIPGFDISTQLARHGVKTEAMRTVSSDVSVGDLLLSEAADLTVDLIVMGAYGHSRLRELVLGGASQRILETMTVPAFLAH